MADRDSSFEPAQVAEGHEILGTELSGAPDTVSEDTAVGAEPVAPKPAPTGLRRLRKPLLIAIPAIAVIVGLGFYLTGGRYQSTENAYLQSGLVAISPRVAGQVTEVLVHDNQLVHKGDILFRIDPAPYQAVVAEAEAQLAAAVTQVRGLRANYTQGQSELADAQQRVIFAQREAQRQAELAKEGISSQSQYDQAMLALRSARQAVQTAIASNTAVAASLSGTVDAAPQQQPAVRRAQSVLDRARLDLAYTVVRAPQDGIVAKVDQLQVGNSVAAARQVFSLSTIRLWVEANFKENQLRYMRVGQPATVTVDAFPDLALAAHVTSFSPGTGSRFAVLPAENATGNWVKVVQRVPTELTLDQIPRGLPLQPGMTVEATVDTGHRRRLFGLGGPGPGGQ
jgi:membrane fusion protein, multidrug efflux system